MQRPAGVGGLGESKPCPAMRVMPLARPPPLGHAAALRSGFSPSPQAMPLLRGCPQVAWAQRELSGCLLRALFRVAKKGELVWTDRAMPTWAGEARDDRWAPEDGLRNTSCLIRAHRFSLRLPEMQRRPFGSAGDSLPVWDLRFPIHRSCH